MTDETLAEDYKVGLKKLMLWKKGRSRHGRRHIVYIPVTGNRN